MRGVTTDEKSPSNKAHYKTTAFQFNYHSAEWLEAFFKARNGGHESPFGPVWVQSIFGVLESYHGFVKYFGFDDSLSVWIKDFLWF